MFVPLSVLEFRDRAATYFGDRIGVVDGELELTYRAWAERTHQLANALNISSIDVENALSAHAAVLECAVVAAPDERFGEVPVAIVVLKPGATATVQELKAHCRAHLARFKVPHEFHFRDALPKGGTGKILKTELREPFWKGFEARVH